MGHLLSFVREVDGFTGSLVVKKANGTLRTGIPSGQFVATVINPLDSMLSSPSVTESIQKPGAYRFTVPAAFLLAHGVGHYPVVVEVLASGPTLNDVFPGMLKVSVQDLDTLATSIQVTGIAGNVWDQLRASHGIVGTFGERVNVDISAIRTAIVTHIVSGNTFGFTVESTLNLLRKILNNRLELADGTIDNWVLYDDDDTTPVLKYDVKDKVGGVIVQPNQAPSRRTRGD
jgi:hypothetical protein